MDFPSIRKYITEPEDAYYYCKEIDNRPEVRKYITDSYWAYIYCREIEKDPEVAKYITIQNLSMVYSVNMSTNANELILKETEVLELLEKETKEACIDSAIEQHKKLKHNKAGQRKKVG